MEWDDFVGVLLVILAVALCLAVLAGFAGLLVFLVRLGWNAAV